MPDEKFRRLLGLLAPGLKQQGFARNGHTFRFQRDGNWGLINFQKSTFSTLDRVHFYVNIGVVCQRLEQLYPPGWYAGRPTIEVCHWRERLDALLSRSEEQWTVDADTRTDDLANEMKWCLDTAAIPTIKKYINDEALRDLWLSQHDGIISGQERLAYLALLLAQLGPEDAMRNVLSDIAKQTRQSGILLKAQAILTDMAKEPT